ncbi:MAG TPA: DMT family transporter [Polyangiaceae bacterium]|nr:DMT family transporter [Polyangiaceae bacterium]
MLGTALALTSALSWSAANLAIQGAARRFGTWGALIWAQLIGGVIAIAASSIVHGLPTTFDGPTLLAVLAAGVSASLAYAGLFQSLRLGQVAVVTPIISAWAVVSVAWAALAGAPLSTLAAIGVACVVIGNGVLARTGSGADSGTPILAIVWATGSALGFGCMVPLIDRIGAALGRLWAIPAVWVVELAVLLPILVHQGRLGPRPRGTADWIVALRTGVFEVGGFIALTFALAFAPITVVSPISSLSTAGSVLLGVIVLRERLRPITLAAAAVACVGVVLVNL